MRGIIELAPDIFISHWASAVGKEEHDGPCGAEFDYFDPTDRFGTDTWEKAEGELCRTVVALLLKKADITADDVDAVFGGDLQNQCTATSHGLCGYGIPFVGLYGACSTATEGLLLASLSMSADGGMAHAVSVTTSHNCAAERQFRLPIEYGGQRAPTAQWTATAGGAVLLSRTGRVRVCRCMIGRMVDGGIKDAGNMGAAMAPAAADTLLRWFSQSAQRVCDYDAIVTGDLGREGSRMLHELLRERALSIEEKHIDLGCLLYDQKTQDAHQGASGCGCSASLLAAHLLPRLLTGAYRRILLLSTGALMSPSSISQGESILGIAPAVCLEHDEES